MNNSQFRVPAEDKRFRPPDDPTVILYKQCLRCRGDLVWSVWVEEWACIQCGWREYEVIP